MTVLQIYHSYSVRCMSISKLEVLTCFTREYLELNTVDYHAFLKGTETANV
jgi:hypothetical protein